MTLNRRFDFNGWGPWTTNDGVYHVLAPRYVLDQMVTVRIHLDHADEGNGCLVVIPRSHRLGILGSTESSEVVEAGNPTSCAVVPAVRCQCTL